MRFRKDSVQVAAGESTEAIDEPGTIERPELEHHRDGRDLQPVLRGGFDAHDGGEPECRHLRGQRDDEHQGRLPAVGGVLNNYCGPASALLTATR